MAKDVRVKWRDFSSVTKRKASVLRRKQSKTGGESSSLPPLTPLMEEVLSIMGPEGHRCL